MFLAKQDIKSVPLQLVHEKVTLAGRNVISNLVDKEKIVHDRMISRKEKEFVERNGTTDDGAIRESYPFVPPNASEVNKEKTEAEQAAFIDIIDKLDLKGKAGWFLPQLVAYIAKMKLPRNAEGKIDGNEFLKVNFSHDEWHKGLYRVCTLHQRGLLVPNQNKDLYKNYSALVPLMMMPFKKYDGVPYSDWINIRNIVDPKLYEAMTYKEECTLTSEEILEARAIGTKVGSGAKAGTYRAPISTYKLYGRVPDEVKQLPWLCQVMVTQIWMAHPSLRTELMVLDWLNWDKMPEPLIDIDVLPTKAVESSPEYTSDLPWEN